MSLERSASDTVNGHLNERKKKRKVREADR